ncbi:MULTISPECIES: hypothetical protein [unclassified Raoultella]|uniref:hypothetical protein n=1 Tax=unclassified Raoultella TaxID=2627600 RepID=UPI00190F6B20|nr:MULTISPECIES: hypothetical protein [unclassified Raoultella]
MYIHHVTFRSHDMEATRDFFISVFDLQAGERPSLIRNSIPGYWLYEFDKPIVHIIPASAEGVRLPATALKESIDPVAFYLEGYQNVRIKLDRLGILYSLMDLVDIDERRIFIRAPGDLLPRCWAYDNVSNAHSAVRTITYFLSSLTADLLLKCWFASSPACANSGHSSINAIVA